MGESAQIASLQGGRSIVYAVRPALEPASAGKQIHEENWPCLQWVVTDATRPLPFRILFDRILVDAPCSGTGTLQRRPEIRWHLRETQLTEFQELQVTLLRNALTHLKPGGTLVYSTCSLELEENEQVLEKLISDHPYFLDLLRGKVEPLFWQPVFSALPSGDERTDGFFAAIIRKKAKRMNTNKRGEKVIKYFETSSIRK